MRKRKIIIYVLFILIAIALVLASFVVQNILEPNHPSLAKFAYDIFIQVGIVVGAIVIVDFLWGIVGGEPLSEQIESLRGLYELQKDADRTGLVRVYSSANEISVHEWLGLINGSKSNIDIVAETAMEIIEQACLSEAIVEKVKRGVKVRILMNSAGNLKEWFVDFAHPNLEDMRTRINGAWAEFQRIYDTLPPKFRHNLQLVQANEGGRFHVAIRRFDEKMYIVHYIYSRRTQDTPVYVIDGSDKALFGVYLNDFERLLQRYDKKL